MTRLRGALAGVLLSGGPALALAGGGYSPAPVTVINDGETPLVCEATLAHWYVIRYGPAAPGRSLTLPLRFEPTSQTVSILNGPGDEMAVERLSCGRVGDLQRSAARPAIRPLARAAMAGRGEIACAPAALKPTDCSVITEVPADQ